MTRQQIKTLQTILDQAADNCVALTYSLDLPFFEYMLFEPLYNRGCRNVTVLCDPGQHETALLDVPALEHLGQRYLCLPIRFARAAFHPKLILLTSERDGSLLLGSGNLTRSGLTHNQEAWTRLEYSHDSPDEFTRAAFRGTFDYLGRLADRGRSPLLRERLQQLWQTTGWLRQEPVQPEDAGCWTLHNLDRPIMDQLIELWTQRDGSAVLEATIVSPYFDKGALAFAALLERLRPEVVSLITENEAPGLDPEGLRLLVDEHGTRLISKRLELGARRLHAKALALRTEQGSWLLTGSPNFSRPAMLRSARDGNAELAMLRHEQDPGYLDLIMSPISDNMSPLDLDWSPSAEETDGASDDSGSAYRIVRAEFAAGKLSVVVDPLIPEGTRVSVELVGREERSFEVDRWDREGEALQLEPPADVFGMFSAPLTMRLLVGPTHDQDASARAVVNSTGTLRSSSRPVRHQAQAHVPVRLVSENFEEDIELLNRLQNLLALNPQQLLERRGLSGRVARELEREAGMTMEEGDYDPEEMIVDERLRRIEVRTGSDLYVDFYERAFYEDVLAAARAAIYRTALEATTGTDDPQQNGPPPDESPSPESQGPTQKDKDAADRVTRSFARLVTGFEKGMQDSEYLIIVPPTYLQELFYILTTYLRSLWRQELVDDDNFFVLSVRLFTSFLGDERESAGLSAISDTSTQERLMRDKHLMHRREQVWLHLYLLADQSLVESEERLPDLARLMRRATQELAPPNLLSDLPTDTFATMWRNSFSRDRTTPERDAVINDLLEYSQWYSEDTLRQELKQSLRVRVIIERKGGWNLPAVPIMFVEGAWSDEHLDTYWQAFCKFCSWPRWKSNARLEVQDSNPALSSDDRKRLILFYRGDVGKLTVLANPQDERFACRKQLDVTSLPDLCNIRSFNDAILAQCVS